MSYYRILLADDEEEVRKAIIRKIDWERLGFLVAGDADNGEEALEKIEQLKPDVVMTDIRMPYMDGLALTERIRQKYPSIKVLIFSGYDDFEYAQQAIKLNVTEYILKPVNGEELTEILNRVRDSLDEEIEQRRNVRLLRESYLNSLPIIRELFLNDLVRGNIPDEEVLPKLEEYEINILGARKWLAAVISVEPEERGEEQPLSRKQEQKLIPISVRQLVEDNLKEYFRFTVFNSAAGITIIAAIDEHNTQTGFIDLLGDICKEVRRILEVTVTIGVGHSSPAPEEVGASYQSAVDALGYKAIVGIGGTIYINDMEPVSRGKLELDEKDEAELTAAIKFGTRKTIEAAVQGLMARMDDIKVHASQYQVYKLSLVNCVTRLMQQYDMDLRQIFDTNDGFMRLMDREQQREEFTEWLTQVAIQMNEAINKRRDTTNRQVIQEAKQYIQEHYTDPDLSVEMICRQLHMSPAYFSTMFRKETGQTYVAYLTDVRLGKAVELLNETNDKTYVIARKVGYQEQNYFSYVFKKKYGVSPTKFRGA